MPLLKILTDPQNFKFYAGGKGYVSTPDSFGQKSIPYGKDQFGGGSSKQPYIVKSININDSQVENTGGPDFLVRGGSLIPGRVADDVSRLTKMFLQKGTEFTVKQNLLSRLNVETQTSIPFLNQGIYTPGQTIAQAAGVAGGLHLPLFLPETKYFEVIKTQREFNASPESNRLYRLYEQKIVPIYADNSVLGTSPILRSYGGGPQAPLGIGKTNIFFADQRTGYYNANYKTDKSFVDFYPLYSNGTEGLNITYNSSFLGATNRSSVLLDQISANSFLQSDPVRSLLPTTPGGVWNDPSQFPLNYFKKDPALFNIEQIQAASPFKEEAVVSVVDFRQTLKNDPVTGQEAQKVLISTNYQTFNRETSYGLGNPGLKTIPRTTLPTTGSKSAGADLINLQKVGNLNVDNDIIPFYFSILNYDNTRTNIQFRAYLETFSETYNADWNNFKYMGRGENFYNYNGFDRTVNLAFNIYASTYNEIFAQYQRLNALVSTTVPQYSGAGIMRGSLTRLTVGDYLNNVPGIIKSLNVDVPKESSWEIGRAADGSSTNLGNRLPFYVQVSNLSFIPIYEDIPQLGSRFITMGENKQGYNY